MRYKKLGIDEGLSLWSVEIYMTLGFINQGQTYKKTPKPSQSNKFYP